MEPTMSTVSFSFIPRTIRLLEDHSYFGLKKENVTIMKQNGVPALMNPECAIATKDDGHIVFKPHGHGDIHLLIDQVSPRSPGEPV